MFPKIGLSGAVPIFETPERGLAGMLFENCRVLLLLSLLVSLLNCGSLNNPQNQKGAFFAASQDSQLHQSNGAPGLEEKRQAFQDFLKNFREITPPLAIPLSGLTTDRFLPNDMLAKIESDQIDRFLIPHLPNFDTEAEDEIFENFNFPNFKSHEYFFYARPKLGLEIESIVFYLNNNFSSYFGLVTYQNDGEFVDQLFVAGREGGSGAMYSLEAVIYPNQIVELNFERASWGENIAHKSVTTRRYKIQPSGRIVRLAR